MDKEELNQGGVVFVVFVSPAVRGLAVVCGGGVAGIGLVGVHVILAHANAHVALPVPRARRCGTINGKEQ